jgi:hypothetical protein
VADAVTGTATQAAKAAVTERLTILFMTIFPPRRGLFLSEPSRSLQRRSYRLVELLGKPQETLLTKRSQPGLASTPQGDDQKKVSFLSKETFTQRILLERLADVNIL